MFGSYSKRQKLQKIIQKLDNLDEKEVISAKLSRMYLREAIGILSENTIYHSVCSQIDAAYSYFGMRRDGQGYKETLEHVTTTNHA